ncbi:35936_t:CDS:2, partial [Racocetra persica]
KTRSDKKDTICKCCGHECSTFQKLRGHLKRKNLCKPLQDKKDIVPIQVFIQEVNQDNYQEKVQVQTPVVYAQKRDRQREKLQVVNQTPVYKPELQREAPTTHDRDYNTVRNEYIDRHARKSGEYLRTWMQDYVKDGMKEKANNEEFRHLRKIPEEEQERNLEFREQEELSTALKRRAIAIHHAKVPKSYSDNGSNIRKMLESRRKQFREILEKKFDKRGQFKFALFYNRDEIDDYLSNTFEQILYQVEERG